MALVEQLRDVVCAACCHLALVFAIHFHIIVYFYCFWPFHLPPCLSLSDLVPGNQMEGLVCFFLSLSFCKGSIEGNNFENLCLMFVYSWFILYIWTYFVGLI